MNGLVVVAESERRCRMIEGQLPVVAPQKRSQMRARLETAKRRRARRVGFVWPRLPRFFGPVFAAMTLKHGQATA